MNKGQNPSYYNTSLAIVGMAGRFPGAGNVAAFWRNLVDGVISIRSFSDDELLAKGVDREKLRDPNYVKAGTVLEGVDRFDAAFFGFTPREAQIMDPQSRLFLQCAWEALEDAGCDPSTYDGLIGVFAGKRFPTYMVSNVVSNPDLVALMGAVQVSVSNMADSLATTLSYKLDLKGPSVSVQTFCSTSLVATHLACQSLLSYECDMALAGGVAVQLPHGVGYYYQEGGITSPDGHCRTFDAQGRGSVFGDGLGIVAIKRLEDALESGDHVYAVIRGSAVNNDGIMRAGYTAPGLSGQAAVIAEALGAAGVDAETVNYVEAHGTATALGDSIELEAMNLAFGKNTDDIGFCAIGSVKPNVGHLDRAAGVTGLIKTALALHHKQIPPHLDFETPNPDFDWENSPFYVNTALAEWKSNDPWPRRAGVNSFGLGGTNAHVVLEEAPAREPSSDSRPFQLLVLSTKSESSLETARANLAAHLRENPDLGLADVAYTLQVGRASFAHRLAVVCSDSVDAADVLAVGDPARVFTAHRVHRQRSAAFVFPGVGDHYPGMARQLYETEPVFRQWVDRCCGLLEPLLERDLGRMLYPADGRAAEGGSRENVHLLREMLGRQRGDTDKGPLQQTVFSQPAVFVVEYALAQLLMAWGIRPRALIGYSLGEYTAACVAGVLSLEDALFLVAKRAQMIQELEPGAMLTVSLPEAKVVPFLEGSAAVVSGVLTPGVCVVAGPPADVDAVQARLAEADIACRRLDTRHAFHTPLLEPAAEPFAEVVKGVGLRPPEIPYLSNVTGDWITAEEATDPAYWAAHLCQQVRLSSGIEALLAEEDLVLLEVGPGQALSSLVKQHPACSREQMPLVLSTLPYAYDRQDAGAFLLDVLGKLWLAGVQVDWSGFYQNERRYRVSLPTYPFEQVRHWVEPGEKAYRVRAQSAAPEGQVEGKRADVADWFYRPGWEEAALSKVPDGEVGSAPWLVFCDELGLGERVVDLVTQRGGSAVSVAMGEEFSQVNDGAPRFTVRPGEKGDYEALCRELDTLGLTPQRIVHLWSVTSPGKPEATWVSRFAGAQTLGFYSLIYLVQALDGQGIDAGVEIAAVTSQAQVVSGSEAVYPEKATVLGACLAIVQECLNVRCRAVDLGAPDGQPWPPEELAESLVRELLAPATAVEIAYRDGERFRRTYEAVRLEEDEESPPPLRPGGTYLITGGLGGIGLVLAEHLARSAQANLALVGRSALPPQDEWEAVLATSEETERVARRIRAVQNLRELGSEVLVLQADVADVARMREIVEAVVARFDGIDGVVHAAGVTSGDSFGPVLSIEPQQCEMHFRPKIYGSYALEAALEGQELDFCLLFSSLSCVLGGLGFVGYTAANLCMDAVAQEHNRAAADTWITVNWDTWRVRETRNEGLGSTVAVYEMAPEEGVAAFERVLARRAEIGTRVVHSTGDLDARVRQWVLLESLQEGPGAPTRATGARPDLPTAYIPVNTDYERRVAAVWQEVLGIDRIGLYDNFFDLGGNSLVGLQLIARLKKEFGAQIPAVALFEAPTVSALARYLQPDSGEEETDALAQVLTERRKRARQNVEQQAVAIVGMAARFPGAKDIDTFWDNLCDGVESVAVFTDEELLAAGVPQERLDDPSYVKARPILEDVDLFDAGFFGYSPRDAEIADPQQRIFLECAWKALETAGYDSKTYPGLIGVFGGKMASMYLLRLFSDPRLLGSLGGTPHQFSAANEIDSLATTISYKLNLRGPSFSVQTFCSTSLVATHLACQSLLNGECDMALAGGVSVRVPVTQGYTFVEGGMESPDGHCRTFDTRAKGTMFGDGVGVVVLKRLEDALADGDVIHAVIKGSAMNNDGSMKVGYSAPSVEAQADVVAAALENAGVMADAIGYVEAHGTATELGDPIEVAALTRAFRHTTDVTRYCPIGSVKTNVGHLDRAAGISGLIKTVLVVKHGLIPPSLHFEEPNPEIDFEGSPFYVNTALSVWESNGQPRRAGLNSLGMGGTNVHLVIEEPPTTPPSEPSRPWQLLTLSARTESALDEMTANLARYLREKLDANLADVAYTLQVGRHVFEHRRVLVCRDVADALSVLESPDSQRLLTHQQPDLNREVVFMFPGVGDHYLQMGKELYETEPVFHDGLERCCSVLYPYLGAKLCDLLYGADEGTGLRTDGAGMDLRTMLGREERAPSPAAQRLNQTAVAQPVTFAIDYALACLLMSWGVRPSALLGYSLGEYVAACLSGVLSLDDALYLVAERARMIQDLDGGCMLAVSLSLEAVRPLLAEDVSLALHNGREMCVLAGSPEAIERLEARLADRQVACRRLDTTHAFHSHMMAPLVEPLTELAQTVKLNPPRIPYLSNVTGTWITEEQATDPGYWARHLCQPVRFFDSLDELLAEKERVLVEVGPGQALGSFAKQHPACARDQVGLVLSTMRYAYDRQSDLAVALGALGKLWLLGCTPDWSSFYKAESRRRLQLPTYPFQRQRYWLEPRQGRESGQAGRAGADSPERLPLKDWFYLPVWNQTAPRVPVQPEEAADWLLFVDECGLGTRVGEWLAARGQRVASVRPGEAFERLEGEWRYAVRPGSREDYLALLRALRQEGIEPDRVVHFWSVTPDGSLARDSDFFERMLNLGFYSLMGLAQAMGDLDMAAYELSVVTSHVYSVIGQEAVCPEKATVAGPCKVIPQEFPDVACRNIDVTVPRLDDGQGQDLVRNLLGELTTEIADGVVALRDRRRWVQTVAPLQLPPLEEGTPALLRQNGVYLVTGGLGGVGLAIAEYLARNVQANLVLTGRSELPPREQWERIVSEKGESDVVRKIRGVKQLEALGAQVLALAADVADDGQMQAAMGQIVDRFGTLHGVVHAAGVPGMGLIQLKTTDAAARVLAPKVIGTLVLERVLQKRGIEPDFVVLFSSETVFTGGGIGQVDYCAANAFLDGYARRHAGNDRLVTSINWGEWQWNAWQEGLEGFSAEVQEYFRTNRQKYGIAFEEGMEAFARILSHRLPRVAVSTRDFRPVVEGSGRQSAMALILAAAEQSREERPKYARPALGVSYAAPRNDLERKIAAVWGDLLGIDQVGINDNFFDLGGNSLVGLNLTARLRKELDVEDVPAHVLYEAPTVSALARFMSQDQQQDAEMVADRQSRGERYRASLQRRRQRQAGE